MTREEAIKVASEMHGWLQTDREREALETLIPELAESDDERITQKLIDAFTYYKKSGEVDFHGIEINTLFAWLEKQKEQKPVDYEAELKKCKDNPLYFYDKYVSIKQKPAEWSEDDEKIINWAIETLEHENYLILAEKLKSLRPQKLDVSKLKNFDPVDVLNRIKTEWPMAWEKVVWKPSEEQMKYLLMLADYFESEGGTSNTKTLRELYENLKKL